MSVQEKASEMARGTLQRARRSLLLQVWQRRIPPLGSGNTLYLGLHCMWAMLMV